MASHLAGIGQQSGTGVGLVHALGHAIGTRGRLPHGLALGVVEPEVLAFYAASQRSARSGAAPRRGRPRGRVADRDPGDRRRRRHRRVARASSPTLGLRPTLRSLGFDDAGLDVVAQDAIDDAAITNSPRLPTLDEARAILASVTA